jgi:hypothetical protein
MTIDKYTKAVLTIIAVALVGLLFKDVPVVSTARAQSSETIDVNIVGINGYSYSVAGGTLQVRVGN